MNNGDVTRAGEKRQRGVALVTALLVVSLATVAAVAMVTRLQVDMRRTGNLLNGEQAYAYAIAAESWAHVILRRDEEESDFDSLGEDWATALPPIAVEGGYVNGQIEDLQGRFNINNLIEDGGEPTDAETAVNAEELAYFERLLGVLGLEAALAPALLDWLDADINTRFPDGAEDDFYLLAEPPYRAANRPMVSISELRLVKGFTPEVVAVLEPHVTALPEETVININTATPAVLRALHQELDDSGVEQLIADRGDTGYEDVDTFFEHEALAGLDLDIDVDNTSDWFNVFTATRVGRGQVQLESIFRRGIEQSQVISRVRSRRPL
ncbi:MAG: type II secretion system minor pseudopilin GspK [Gammaproteobacteria bacterium]|nr:type II secretion system minor pseudopilin GspK [Gammaproteobacteria bacterium]